MPQGRWPTGIRVSNVSCSPSITATLLPRPVATYTRFPSGETTTPFGFSRPGSFNTSVKQLSYIQIVCNSISLGPSIAQ